MVFIDEDRDDGYGGDNGEGSDNSESYGCGDNFH